MQRPDPRMVEARSSRRLSVALDLFDLLRRGAQRRRSGGLSSVPVALIYSYGFTPWFSAFTRIGLPDPSSASAYRIVKSVKSTRPKTVKQEVLLRLPHDGIAGCLVVDDVAGLAASSKFVRRLRAVHADGEVCRDMPRRVALFPPGACHPSETFPATPLEVQAAAVRVWTAPQVVPTDVGVCRRAFG